jgi:hypothetical protein
VRLEHEHDLGRRQIDAVPDEPDLLRVERW